MSLPVDRSRDFHKYDYPNKPGLYTPLIHFIQRFKEDERFLTRRVIEETIRDGDVLDNGDGCAAFRKFWGEGVAYYLIAGFHDKGYRILITGWPHVHSREAALDSGDWSSKELDTIKALNDRTSDRFEAKYPKYNKWLKT